ncbi:MAG: helicase-associated domain-containing protein [Anaerolineales bacterium]|nr:helicase-associated domain-containing protein [Anaerolineales bacterium]MBX3036749.1 helicase-associated domain-containing protein [Anaerolineales bacterium]
MPDLSQSLQKSDIGQLRIIAEFWGLELESNDFDSALEELGASLVDLETVSETLSILQAPAQTALTELINSNGKMEWSVFARKHGEIREMGAGKRDREKPHLKPTSTSEILFYRGFIAKSFFETDKGLQEFAYIPDDLLEVIQEVGLQSNEVLSKNEPLGRPATPVEKSFETPANDFILDDATTYLAALRMNIHYVGAQYIAPLLATANLIKNNIPQTETVKAFLEANRTDALNTLYQAWLKSDTFDELRLIPSIICEGEWKNQPQITREFLMNLMNDIPQGKWWSLNAFVKAIKEKFPDFQRPAGDYDSWFIKRESDGQYLRGFAYWDSVDGTLIRYLIQTLHWLGKVDLASAEEGKIYTAFRVTELRDTSNKLQGKMIVASNGKISVSRYFSRAIRYQIARFCEWDGLDTPSANASGYSTIGDEYKYFITAKSLKRANEQGLKAEQLLNLLVKHTNGNVPPALVKALKNWNANGSEVRVENLVVLRVNKPEIIEEARKSKAGKYFGELLSPTAVIIKSGAIQKVMEIFAELGLLIEGDEHDKNKLD